MTTKYSLVTATEVLLIEREIQHLLTTLAHKIDDGMFDEVAELFEHAEYQVDGGTSLGRDALARHLNDTVQRYEDGTPRTWHSITNVAVEIDPLGDTASSVSYYTLYQQSGGSPFEPVCAGRWHDTFDLSGGEWRFRSHVDEPRLTGEARRGPTTASP